MQFVKNILLFTVIAFPLMAIFEYLFQIDLTWAQITTVLVPFIVGTIVSDEISPIKI